MKRLILLLAVTALSFTASAQRPVYLGIGGGYIAPDLGSGEIYLAWNAWYPAQRAWMFDVGLNFRPVDFEEKLEIPARAISSSFFFDAGRNVNSDVFYLGGRLEVNVNSFTDKAKAMLTSEGKEFASFLGLGGHLHAGVILPLGNSAWLKLRGSAGANWYNQRKSSHPPVLQGVPTDAFKFSVGLSALFEFLL